MRGGFGAGDAAAVESAYTRTVREIEQAIHEQYCGVPPTCGRKRGCEGNASKQEMPAIRRVLRRRERREAAQRPTIDALAQQLMDGIEGAQLYDAWGGLGLWTPTVRLNERNARIVAAWALRSTSPTEATP